MKKTFPIIFLLLLIEFINAPAEVFSQEELNLIGLGVLCVLRFSPQDDYFATANYSGDIFLWELDNKRPIKHFKRHYSPILDLKFSYDGNYLASGDSSGNLDVWDIKTGNLYRSIKFSLPVNCIDFHPKNSDLIAIGFWRCTSIPWRGMGQIWDIKKGKKVRILEGWYPQVHEILFTHSGDFLIGLTGDSKKVDLWETKSGKRKRIFVEESISINSIEISQDDKLILASKSDGNKYLYELKSGKNIKVLKNIEYAKFYPQPGNIIIAIVKDDSNKNHIKFWDIYADKETRSISIPFSPEFISLSPNGKYIITSSEDKVLRIIDLETGILSGEYKGHYSWVSSFAISPSNSLLIMGERDGNLTVWDYQKNDFLKRIDINPGEITSINFSPEGSLFALVSKNGTLIIFDSEDYKQILCRRYNSPLITVNFISPTTIITGDKNNILRILDLKNESESVITGESEGQCDDIIISPKGSVASLFVKTDQSGRFDKAVIWEIDPKRIITSINIDWHHALAFSSRGDKLLYADPEDNLFVVNLADLKRERLTISTKKPILSVTFSNNDEYYSYSQETRAFSGFTHIVHLKTNKEIAKIPILAKEIKWSKDDETLILDPMYLNAIYTFNLGKK